MSDTNPPDEHVTMFAQCFRKILDDFVYFDQGAPEVEDAISSDASFKELLHQTHCFVPREIQRSTINQIAAKLSLSPLDVRKKLAVTFTLLKDQYPYSQRIQLPSEFHLRSLNYDLRSPAEIKEYSLYSAFQRTEERRKALSVKEQAVHEREKAANERETALTQREKAADERQKAADERETALTQRETALTQREIALTQQEAAVQKREQIRDLEDELMRNEAEMNKDEQAVKEIQEKLKRKHAENLEKKEAIKRLRMV